MRHGYVGKFALLLGLAAGGPAGSAWADGVVGGARPTPGGGVPSSAAPFQVYVPPVPDAAAPGGGGAVVIDEGPAPCQGCAAGGPGNPAFTGCAAPAVPQGYGYMEYLLWFFSDNNVNVPLLTTTSDIGAVNAGALNDPAARVLIGPGAPGSASPMSGGRLTVGTWFGQDSRLGFEARGFLTEHATSRTVVASDANGNPYLALPLADAATGQEIGAPIALPFQQYQTVVEGFPVGFLAGQAGGMTVTSQTRLWGVEGNGMYALARGERGWLGGLLGFRYLDLQEDMTILTTSRALTGPPPVLLPFNIPIPGAEGIPILGVAGTKLGPNGGWEATDHFRTRNQFYGGQLGLSGQMFFDRFFVGGAAKVGLGSMHQVLVVSGNTVGRDATGQVLANSPAGIYALQSNSGRYTNDTFAVIPEAEIRAGVRLTPHLTTFAGYGFTYISDVIRPGDQITRSTDTRGIPTIPPGDITAGTAPAPRFDTSDFWVHGLNFGVQVAW